MCGADIPDLDEMDGGAKEGQKKERNRSGNSVQLDRSKDKLS